MPPIPVTFLKGVKTVRAAQLAQLGVYTVEDLCNPVSYTHLTLPTTSRV